MFNSLRRGLASLSSRKIYFFMLIVVPVAGAFFFLNLMSEGLPLRITVSMVDMDHSAMSRQITRQLRAGELTDITSNVDSYNEALAKVRAGETFGFFYIPQNFQKDVEGGRKPTLSFFCNMSVFVPGTLAFKGFKTVAVTTSGGVVEATLASLGAESVIGSGESLMMPLNVDTHPIGNPWMNYNIYLSNSFLPALLALIAMTMTVFSICIEIKQGTSPEWIANSRGHIGVAIFGKLFPQTVILCAIGVAIQAVMYGWLGFPMHCPAWRMVLAMILLIVASQCWALTVCEIVPNMRLALILVSLTSILAFSVAGFSFPVEKMYGAVGIFSYILPIRYYFLIYIDQALNGWPLYYSRAYYAVLLVMTLVPLLGFRRLKSKCLTPVYVP